MARSDQTSSRAEASVSSQIYAAGHQAVTSDMVLQELSAMVAGVIGEAVLADKPLMQA